MEETSLTAFLGRDLFYEREHAEALTAYFAALGWTSRPGRRRAGADAAC